MLGKVSFSNKVEFKDGVTFSNTIDVLGKVSFSNGIQVIGTTQVETFNSTGHASFSSNVGISGDLTVSSNVKIHGDFIVDGKATFCNEVEFLGSSFTVPVGTTNERKDPAKTGSIRYNTDLDAFEGFDGSEWTYIGAVRDGNTYIEAEGDTISVVTDGITRITVGSNVGIGVDNPVSEFHVNGVGTFCNISLPGIPDLRQALSIGRSVDPPYVLDLSSRASTVNQGEILTNVTIDETETLTDTFTIYAFASLRSVPAFSNSVQFNQFLLKMSRYGDNSGVSSNILVENSNLLPSVSSDIPMTKYYDTRDYEILPSNIEVTGTYRIQVMVENSGGEKTVLKEHDEVLLDEVFMDVFAPTYTKAEATAEDGTQIKVNVEGISDIGVAEHTAYVLATQYPEIFTNQEIFGIATGTTAYRYPVSNITNKYLTQYYYSDGQQTLTKRMTNYTDYNVYVVLVDNHGNIRIDLITNQPVRTLDEINPINDKFEESAINSPIHLTETVSRDISFDFKATDGVSLSVLYFLESTDGNLTTNQVLSDSATTIVPVSFYPLGQSVKDFTNNSVFQTIDQPYSQTIYYYMISEDHQQNRSMTKTSLTPHEVAVAISSKSSAGIIPQVPTDGPGDAVLAIAVLDNPSDITSVLDISAGNLNDHIQDGKALNLDST